jgi:hypothetical protein
LFCHSIELVLKAYLAQAAGLTEDQLQKPPFGQNIKNLLNRAIQCGLRLTANTKASIGLLTEAHTKRWPRYPMKKLNTVVLKSTNAKQTQISSLWRYMPPWVALHPSSSDCIPRALADANK